jgi:serine/threonine-protein kinase HipA
MARRASTPTSSQTARSPKPAARLRERECFVYIQLPRSTEVVTCGRFSQEETVAGGVVGRFVYGRSYRLRPDAVPLDPFNLPLSDRVYTTAKLGGIFGAVRDASPDKWGRLVIERALGRTDLTEVDFLLQSPEDRAGALSFGRGTTAPPPVWEYNRVVQLPELLEAARLLQEDPSGKTIPDAMRHAELLLQQGGTSMGGARAKSVVEDEEGLWLAKFPERADRWTNAAVEAAMLALARRCEIHTPKTRVRMIGPHAVLMVKRFDREQLEPDANDHSRYLRHRMVSALTVLDAEESPTDRRNWSYLLLADELRRWSGHPRQDRQELFRRMVLNALVSNLDDHPRNHALIAPGKHWQLAPAYDITPDPRPGQQDRDLAMICGRLGRRARRANLLSAATRFDLSAEDANRIIDRMVNVARAEWESEVRRQGGTDADCAAIAPAFVHEGFEYEVVEQGL